MFATIPEKLPGHLSIPVHHTIDIWSHLSSPKTCIPGCSEAQDYMGEGEGGKYEVTMSSIGEVPLNLQQKTMFSRFFTFF